MVGRVRDALGGPTRSTAATATVILTTPFDTATGQLNGAPILARDDVLSGRGANTRRALHADRRGERLACPMVSRCAWSWNHSAIRSNPEQHNPSSFRTSHPDR